MKETYKQRVMRFYKKERAENNPAIQAMRSAKFEAKYGEGSFKQNITPLTHGEAYEGEEEHEIARDYHAPANMLLHGGNDERHSV